MACLFDVETDGKSAILAKGVPVEISDGEKECLDLLAKSWNAFIVLPPSHQDDQEEFRRAIHQAQNIIAARIAKRVDPEIWS